MPIERLGVIKMEKITIQFSLSVDFRTHIESFAAKQKLSTAALIRLALASYTKYNLNKEPKSSRSKYATPEERKAAARERAAKQRALVRQLMDEHRRAERQRAIEALEASLNK